jgi:hypothetical protein
MVEDEAGQAVRDMYGADFYKGPRQYQTKVRNAQEAVCYELASE